MVEQHFAETKSKREKQDLGSLADIIYGITLGGRRAKFLNHSPYLRVANVLRERLDLTEIKTIGCTADEETKFALRHGDILIVEGHAGVHEIGRSAVWHEELAGILHQNHLIRVRCSNALLPDYLNLYINSAGGRAYFRRHAKSSSGLNTINSTVVKKLPVPLTSLGDQTHLTAIVCAIDSTLMLIQRAQTDLADFLRRVMRLFHELLGIVRNRTDAFTVFHPREKELT